MKKIHAAYFTCSDHFNELLLSVKSLINVHEGCVQSIYLYCDKTDPFTDEQVKEVEKLPPMLPVILKETVLPMSWGGEKTVTNLLTGFQEISSTIDPDDYIMNIDSDTIFLSSKVLQDALNASEDFLGEQAKNIYINAKNPSEQSEPFTYIHGCCFFVKGSLAIELLPTYLKHKEAILRTVKRLTFTEDDYIPPDHQVNLAAIKCKASIKTLGKITVPKDHSLLHMELTKNDHWASVPKLFGVKKLGSHLVTKNVRSNILCTTVIVSDGRCGTNLIGLSLWKRPEIEFLDEALNCTYIDKGRTLSLFPKELLSIAIKHFGTVKEMYSYRPNSWNEYAINQENLIPYFNDVCQVGNLFKIHYSHCPPSHYEFWKHITSLEHVRFLHIKRSSKFDMFVSRLVADRTQIWHIPPNGNGVKDESIYIDPQSFVEFFSHIERNEIFFDNILPPERTMNLSFRDVTKEFDYTINAIQKFMGLNPIHLEKAAKKRTLTPYRDLVSNYEELRIYFKDTKWNKYFIDRQVE